METMKIGVLVGSLRRESYSRRVAQTVMGMMPEGFDVQLMDIGGLPIYNQDFDDDGQVPAAWQAFREAAKGLDGFLFVTPEYNRSVPPVLKNALDVGSRPYGSSVWDGKPGAVISVSTGKVGGFGANHHLRQSLTFLDVYAMQQPEAYINNCTKMLDDNGKVTDERSRKFLQEIADAFAQWVARFDG